MCEISHLGARFLGRMRDSHRCENYFALKSVPVGRALEFSGICSISRFRFLEGDTLGRGAQNPRQVLRHHRGATMHLNTSIWPSISAPVTRRSSGTKGGTLTGILSPGTRASSPVSGRKQPHRVQIRSELVFVIFGVPDRRPALTMKQQ